MLEFAYALLIQYPNQNWRDELARAPIYESLTECEAMKAKVDESSNALGRTGTFCIVMRPSRKK